MKEKKKKEKAIANEDQNTFEPMPSNYDDILSYKKNYLRSFPKTYDPEFVEKFWNEWWEKNNFYHVTSNEGETVDPSKRYIIILPPPNVTGSLHIGHALTGGIEDCLCRWKRMCGFKTVYVPGVDHAGIAT